MTLSIAPETAADGLHDWYTSFRAALELTVFGVATSEVHRRAAARLVVTRHVRELQAALSAGQRVLEIREIAWILMGATRALAMEVRREHWLSAAQSVVRLDAQLDQVGSAWVGDVVTVFRDHFLEALGQAGMSHVATNLDPKNRTTALGLSVNWGLRYLVAAAATLIDHEVTDPAVQEIVAAVGGKRA